MNCDAVSQNLKALLDGELPRLQAWRVRRHLARCADCREAWAKLQSFNAALRVADLFPPEAATPISARPMRVSRRLALGALVTAALAAFLFVLPFGRQPKDMGAAVAAALARTNTWHLTGWKQIDGKRVPWDIWGRRKPFLFYERVGDTITVDDGTKRLRLFPPNPALNRPRGLVVRTATQRPPTGVLVFAFEPTVENMVGQWDWRQGGGMYAQKPFRQTLTQVLFRRQDSTPAGQGVNANNLYTINKLTWLPAQYQLHYNTAQSQWDTEKLSAEYDVTLPRAVRAPAVPLDYGQADFTNTQTITTGETTTRHGISAQATPLALDKDGLILVRIQGRIGDAPLTPNSTFALYISYLPGIVGQGTTPDGKTVRYLNLDRLQSSSPGGDTLLLLAPLEPHAAVPKTLRLTMSVSATITVKGTDMVDARGVVSSGTRGENLFTEDWHWTMPLPSKPTVTDIASAWPGGFPANVQGQSLKYNIYQALSSYYYMKQFGFQEEVFQRIAPDLVGPGAESNLAKLNRREIIYKRYSKQFKQAQQEERLRAIYWQQRKIAVLSHTGQDHWTRQNDRQLLANFYLDAGDKKHSRQILREVIAEYQTMPQHGGLGRRQAEYALRTGLFPGDADYKGPS